eukprot:g26696.t1
MLVMAMVPGCSFSRLFSDDLEDIEYVELAGEVQYDEALADDDPTWETRSTREPRTIRRPAPGKYKDMSLDEIVEVGLQNSKVLRDLGGTVLRTPELAKTIHGPAIQETDPRFGVAAALSAFDAQLSSSGFFENNDRALNNTFFGGGTRTLKQDFNLYQTQVSKRTATGAEFSLRNNTDYDANNAPGNLFRSAWNTNIEAEVRQPLLRGAGVFFNRTAGPGGAPGVTNGIVIARVNRDISLTRFQMALRDYLSNLENAYWDLYFAYRNLDAKKRARDASLKMWQTIRARLGQRGFEADKEAQAREQYLRFQQEVHDALTGRIVDGTRTNSGSTGGTFRPTVGVHVAERRLRLLMGWPVNGDELIRPRTEPVIAPIEFDWNAVLSEALARRPELLAQRQRVKRRELELAASRSFLKPRLDAVGRYRWRGFGKDLIDNRGDNADRFDNAVENLTNGDFQEWQLGFELSIPIGFRQARSAVRNAELQVARERTILREQERQITYGLSNAIEDVERSYHATNLAYNRVRAAKTRVAALRAIDATRTAATPDQLLEADSRLAIAESAYFQSLVEYMLAMKNVHLEKGSLFDFRGVQLDGGTAQSARAFPESSLQTIPEPIDDEDPQTPSPGDSLDLPFLRMIRVDSVEHSIGFPGKKTTYHGADDVAEESGHDILSYSELEKLQQHKRARGRNRSIPQPEPRRVRRNRRVNLAEVQRQVREIQWNEFMKSKVPEHGDFVFTKQPDNATPQLAYGCSSQEIFPLAVFFFRRKIGVGLGGVRLPFMVIGLRKVRLAGWSLGADLSETVTCKYADIAWTSVPPLADTNLPGAVTVKDWDTEASKSFDKKWFGWAVQGLTTAAVAAAGAATAILGGVHDGVEES